MVPQLELTHVGGFLLVKDPEDLPKAAVIADSQVIVTKEDCSTYEREDDSIQQPVSAIPTTAQMTEQVPSRDQIMRLMDEQS